MIEFVSSPGENGAVFRIWLPVNAASKKEV